jgi:cholesterol oxidase
MRSSYDAVVIGSGFGGGVAACRLAQAGLRVGVIERGRRYDVNPFPRNWSDPQDGWLWEIGQGLFDIKPLQAMTVVQAAGLGGGSLIYANVHLRAPEAVFQHGWPAGYSRAALDPYYDLVAYMLDIQPITKAPLGLPPKSQMMKMIAAKLGRSDQFCYPNIAVDFGLPEAAHQNKFGAQQRGCNFCGECDIGCNYHAKNTVDLNYLKVAADSGADLAAQCETIAIEPSGDGYKVRFIDHAAGRQPGQTQARQVFVCAGAVNSTELLLKSRAAGKLTQLSDRLGQGYSGNGDFLAFAFDTATSIEPSRGPTITTGIVYSRRDDGIDNWFILEEGGYPKQVGGMLQALKAQNSLDGEQIRTWSALQSAVGMAARGRVGAADPAAERSAVFLAMGCDLANGVIRLNPVTGELQIGWDVASNLPLYGAEQRLANDVAIAMGGKLALNPLWKLLRIPVSVHNLGGCVMADSPTRGVTDGTGQVYGYPGLYVLDGAILPAATGVNPSHTIAAVAERNVEAAIRRITGNGSWRAPEAASAKAIIDPLRSITIPPGGTVPTKTHPVGIAFTETMKGYVAKGWNPPDAYLGAEGAGQAVDSRMDFTLTITLPDLDAFLASQEHAGIAKGVVHVNGFTPAEGAPVSAGVFNLFVSGDGADRRRMLYALPFLGSDGQMYLLDGWKDVRDHGNFDVWASTSTLYTRIRQGQDTGGPVAATGIIKIMIPDFMHQLTTFTVIGTDDPAVKAQAFERFGRMFFGSLWEVFVRPHLPA